MLDCGLDPLSRQHQIPQTFFSGIGYGIHAQPRYFDAPPSTTDFSGSIKKIQISEPVTKIPAVT
jgi:hypothetical protein